MFIQKITLIEFDEVAERERIMNVFKKKQQRDMLVVLDLMVAGDFEALAHYVKALDPKLHECLAMPIVAVVKDILERELLQHAIEDGYTFKCTKRERTLMSMKGIPMGPEGAQFPRYIAGLPAAPDAPPAAAPAGK